MLCLKETGREARRCLRLFVPTQWGGFFGDFESLNCLGSNVLVDKIFSKYTTL